MNISSFAYQKFYEVLYDQFVSKAISDKRQEQLVPDSGDAWLEVNPTTGKLYFYEIFGFTVTNPKHFYRKVKEFDPAKANVVHLKDPMLIKAFQFLGLAMPDAVNGKTVLTVHQKAKILYQLFLERHYPELLAENRTELEVYDHASGKLVKEKNDIQTLCTNDNSTPMVEKDLSGGEEQAVTELVTKFYKHISLSRLEDAWNLLAPAFQKRNWKNGFDTFSMGYTNTISVHHVHVFDIARHSSGIKCKLYYEDDLVTRTSIELGNLGKMRVSELEIFIERINRIRAAAASAGLEDFEKIELQKFFEPVFSEYVWYRCGMNTDSIAELLPSQETITFHRLYTVSCILLENQWYINAINPIKHHPIR